MKLSLRSVNSYRFSVMIFRTNSSESGQKSQAQSAYRSGHAGCLSCHVDCWHGKFRCILYVTIHNTLNNICKNAKHACHVPGIRATPAACISTSLVVATAAPLSTVVPGKIRLDAIISLLR